MASSGSSQAAEDQSKDATTDASQLDEEKFIPPAATLSARWAMAVALGGPSDVMREIEELEQDEKDGYTEERSTQTENFFTPGRLKEDNIQAPKARRTKEEIANLETFHVHDETQADDGDHGDADSRSASTVSLTSPLGDSKRARTECGSASVTQPRGVT